MKKSILTLFTAIIVFCAGAQTKIAIKGGFNYNTARVYQYGVKQPNKFNPGFGIGILIKTQFDGLLRFSPYAGYNMRGYKYDRIVGANDTTFSNTIHYLDLVPALSLDFPAGGSDDNLFVVSGGPQLGIALAGTEKRTVKGVTTSSRMKINTDGDYGFFDLGLGMSIGYHTRKFLVEVGYQLGFANINNDGDLDGRNIRNRMISFNLGYYIR